MLLGFCGEDENTPPPWTTGAPARDSDGDPVAPTSWDAVAWSLPGMVARCIAERATARGIDLTEQERDEAERELLACFVHYGLRRVLPLRPEGYEQAIAAFNDLSGLPFSDIAMTCGRVPEAPGSFDRCYGGDASSTELGCVQADACTVLQEAERGCAARARRR